MRFIAYTGGEVQPIAGSSRMVVAKAQRPQPVVLDRMSVRVAEQAIEAPAGNVIDSDLPASGIADQQVVAEEAEIFLPPSRRTSNGLRVLESAKFIGSAPSQATALRRAAQ